MIGVFYVIFIDFFFVERYGRYFICDIRIIFKMKLNVEKMFGYKEKIKYKDYKREIKLKLLFLYFNILCRRI